MNASEFSVPAACSLTHLFTSKAHPKTVWLDSYSEPLRTIINRYKRFLQSLQMEILINDLENTSKIGECFEDLERVIENLIIHCASK